MTTAYRHNLCTQGDIIYYKCHHSASETDLTCVLWGRRLITNAMGKGEDFLQSFINHEKKGVPAGAGKDDKGGFDMVRLHRVEHFYIPKHHGCQAVCLHVLAHQALVLSPVKPG